jgi:hypothetical protein
MSNDNAAPQESAAPITLKDHEKLALCGLARVLMRCDGGVSQEELDTLSELLDDLFSTQGASGAPYRDASEQSAAGTDVGAWLERADVELPDDASVRDAASAIERPEAQKLLLDALFCVAAADTVSDPEWAILDWLADLWGQPRPERDE